MPISSSFEANVASRKSFAESSPATPLITYQPAPPRLEACAFCRFSGSAGIGAIFHFPDWFSAPWIVEEYQAPVGLEATAPDCIAVTPAFQSEVCSTRSSLMDSDDSFTIYPVSTFSEESGYVINTDSKDTLRKFVQKFRQEVFPGDFFVVSDSFAIQDINEIFQEIRNCTKGQRFYHKGKNLAYQHELLPLLTNHEQQASSYLTKIVHKDYALAVKELENFFTTILEQPIDPAYLKHEAINRFYALLNALADEHVGNEELSLLKIALPSLLADAEYFEDFSILVKETLEKLTHFSANAKKDNFDILTLIYEFVQENYEKEINLQLLSEKYHFSYSYLSAIFTEKFGINFSKYLKKVRISKAKLFLTETRLTLTEICEKVGYTELGYFSRVFKEETGMTPSQYRKGTFVK